MSTLAKSATSLLENKLVMYNYYNTKFTTLKTNKIYKTRPSKRLNDKLCTEVHSIMCCSRTLVFNIVFTSMAFYRIFYINNKGKKVAVKQQLGHNNNELNK